MHGYYRISGRVIVSLKQNERDRWDAAQDALSAKIVEARKAKDGRKVKFTDDEQERLVGLAVLAEVGVIKRSFPGAQVQA